MPCFSLALGARLLTPLSPWLGRETGHSAVRLLRTHILANVATTAAAGYRYSPADGGNVNCAHVRLEVRSSGGNGHFAPATIRAFPVPRFAHFPIQRCDRRVGWLKDGEQ
jgi:hypothetical protein